MTFFIIICTIIAIVTILIMRRVFTYEDKIPLLVMVIGWPLFFCILLYVIFEHMWTSTEEVHVRFKE